MSLLPKNTVNYNDFSQLSRLRVDARKDEQAALREVAKQFESVFVQMMIKSMREASVPLQGELFHSQQSKAYTDMYDKQLGLELAKDNGIGLADVIVRQLSRVQGQPVDVKPSTSLDLVQQPLTRTSLPAMHVKAEKTEAVIDDMDLLSQGFNTEVASFNPRHQFEVTESHKTPHWADPASFIRDSWPHAVRAGKELDIDPRAILAQSALETGWGKKVHATENGDSSYSLFGIKAGKNWDGKTVQFNTVEYSQGQFERQLDQFRAYDSVAEAYRDYVSFLKANPRYREALAAGSVKEFSRALQDAGYATDPAYAEKIQRISNSSTMSDALSALKFSSEVPLS